MSTSWQAVAQPRFEGDPPIVCLSSPETRDLFVANKLVQPFQVMREAERSARAEAIDIQLCRVQGILVYDVTLLDSDGRVIHRLISAANGNAMGDHPSMGPHPPTGPGRPEAPDRSPSMPGEGRPGMKE